MNDRIPGLSAGTQEGAILVIPACEEGKGGGHLYRSAALVSSIRAGGGRAWLSPSTENGFSRRGFPAASGIQEDLFMDEKTASCMSWSLVILDTFRTKPEEVRRWREAAPVLGIDEGRSRGICDFLLDLFPGISGEAPNSCTPSMLPLPLRRRSSFYGPVLSGSSERQPCKILLCFGAEDAAGLTVPAALALQNCRKNGMEKIFSLTAVAGPLCRDAAGVRSVLEKAGLTVLSAPVLGTILADYDLFVTHFGIAAFEALYARVPVLLLNPGSYHEKLARRAGFVSAGSGKRSAARLDRFFGISRGGFFHILEQCSGQSEAAALRWGMDGERDDLAAFLRTSAPRVYRHCPLCGARCLAGRKAIRFPGRTYRRCSCGTFCMNRLDPPPVSYNRDYFFESYRKQYGKTYLEDFPQLKKAGERRLEKICALLPGKTNEMPGMPRLLDLGCAYGPFLAAAEERGFAALGQEAAEDAAVYAREKLGLRVLTGIFPGDVEQITGTLKPGETFDVITLWYLIEHFPEPGKALEILGGLLKTGGVLAFSTPSAAGISRRKSLRSFLEQSPEDHWTIWDPRRCRRILRRYGFRLRKVAITGHHPERFPLIGTFFKPVSGVQPHIQAGILYRTGILVSRIFGLGDTFEAYAVKTGRINRDTRQTGGEFHG